MLSEATMQVWATGLAAPIVWLAACDRGIHPDWEASQLCLLHESERQRYCKLLRPQRRRQFLVGRTLLRHALSDLFDGSPESWQIRERPGLAPELASATPSPITFSLAHSRDQVVCILTSGTVVGVDIEYTGRQRDFLCMAARFFHPENVRQLQELQEDRAAGFYRLWTLHEAAFKICNESDGVSKSPNGYGRDPEPVFATTVVGHYSIAVAVRGGGLPSAAIRQFDPEACVEIRKDVSWDLYRAECFVPGGSSPAFFAPCSRSDIVV
jgi:4'-phosphopantetheinyl transferase